MIYSGHFVCWLYYFPQIWFAVCATRHLTWLTFFFEVCLPVIPTLVLRLQCLAIRKWFFFLLWNMLNKSTKKRVKRLATSSSHSSKKRRRLGPANTTAHQVVAITEELWCGAAVNTSEKKMSKHIKYMIRAQCCQPVCEIVFNFIQFP